MPLPKLTPWMWAAILTVIGVLLLFWPRQRITSSNQEPWQRSGYVFPRIHEAVYTAISWPYLLAITLTVNYLVRQDSLSQTGMFGGWGYVFVRRSTPVALAAFAKNDITGPGVPPRTEAAAMTEGVDSPVFSPGEDSPTAELDPTKVA